MRDHNRLTEMKLKIAGNLNDCVDILGKHQFDYLGLLKEDEIIKELNKAQFLINIDNQDIKQQPPGKIVEYMQLQKPIINFYACQSLSGASLKRFSTSLSSYLEINLLDDIEINLNKIKNYHRPDRKLFEVPDTFETLYDLYYE